MLNAPGQYNVLVNRKIHNQHGYMYHMLIRSTVKHTNELTPTAKGFSFPVTLLYITNCAYNNEVISPVPGASL